MSEVSGGNFCPWYDDKVNCLQHILAFPETFVSVDTHVNYKNIITNVHTLSIPTHIEINDLSLNHNNEDLLRSHKYCIVFDPGSLI